MRRTSLVILALVAVVARRAYPDATKKPTGMLIFSEPSPDPGPGSQHWRTAWLDLVSGTTGFVKNEPGSTLTYQSGQTSLWIGWSGEKPHDYSGALHLSRDGKGLGERFVRNTTVVSVSPTGKSAVVYGKTPGPWDLDFVLARVTEDGFEQVETFGFPTRNSAMYGWFDDRTILVADPDGLWRVTPGKKRVKVGVANDFGEGAASHSMKLFAWSTDKNENQQQALHIIPLDKKGPERVLPLGKGEGGKCAFAPDDKTIACMVGEPYTGDLRQFVVDVASGQVTMLPAKLGTGITFSPDGRTLALFADEITLYSLDGKQPRRLGRKGVPVAWLR